MCKSVAAGGWVGCLACMLPRPSVQTASRGRVTHHGTIQNQRRSTISIHSVSDRTGGCHIQLIHYWSDPLTAAVSLSFLLLAFVVVLVLFPPQSFFLFAPFVLDTKNVKKNLVSTPSLLHCVVRNIQLKHKHKRSAELRLTTIRWTDRQMI